MTKITFSVIFLVLVKITNVDAQQWKSYQWKNRVLVIEGTSQKLISEQLQIFERNAKDISERQFLIFTSFIPDEYANSTLKIKEFVGSKNQGDFKLTIIGLDGGQKAIKNKPIKIADLNNFIDAMPMRQSELKK